MRASQIVRDVLIIFALTFVGGFVIGVAVGKQGQLGQNGIAAVAVSNLALSAVGFCIVGAMAKTNRFKHLIVVAVAAWLCSAINMLFMPTTVVQWAFSIVLIFITMGIGGALSFLFVKTPKDSAA